LQIVTFEDGFGTAKTLAVYCKPAVSGMEAVRQIPRCWHGYFVGRSGENKSVVE